MQTRVQCQAEKILAAVHERLVKEINYWSDRYPLSDDVAAGKQPRMQPENARRRVEELTARLEQRTRELQDMQQVSSATPVVIGGALIIPAGLLAQRRGDTTFCANAEARSRIEWVAMHAVIQAEQALGHTIKDVSAEKCGWDITARPPVAADGSLRDDRHIEVKGRVKGASTVTVTKNEIFSSFNQGENISSPLCWWMAKRWMARITSNIRSRASPNSAWPVSIMTCKSYWLGLLNRRRVCESHQTSTAKLPLF